MRKMLWPWMVMWCSLAGISAEDQPKEVEGILGESVTFHLQSPRPFDVVLWGKNGMHVASLRRETPCNFMLLRAYIGRMVTTSKDCSSLRIDDVRKEDAAGYKAEFVNLKPLDIVATQSFTLMVYKRLSEADLDVDCEEEIHQDGNTTLHLNCSAGKWGDGVGFSWTSPGRKDIIPSSEMSLDLLPNSHDEDQNVTCVAENPVSNASRTVSLKQACARNKDSPSSPSPFILIPVVVVSLLLVIAMAVGLWKFKRNKAADRELITPSNNSGPKDCKSLYAEIKNPQISDAEMGGPQQGRGSRAHKEMPITIYADVQHPEKTPLQTDDEKIRREKRRAAEKSDKTIYSEISGCDMKEANQGNLKTIYDTVNLPKPPEASEYNKIL